MFSKYVDSVGVCIGTIVYLTVATWVIINSNLIGISNIIYFEDISFQMLFMVTFLIISIVGITIVSTFMDKMQLFMFQNYKRFITTTSLLISSVPLNVFMLMTLTHYQHLYINILIIGIYISLINSAFAYLLIRSSIGICWNINITINKMGNAFRERNQ